MLPTVRMPRGFLGQPDGPFRVVVVDPNGNPFSGVRVTLQGDQVSEKTDSDGIARFTFRPHAADVVAQVEIGDFTMKARGRTDETLFVTVPIAAPGPLLTPVELGALLLGGAATAFGALRKQKSVLTVGEVLLGAGIFTAVYRHSCRW